MSVLHKVFFFLHRNEHSLSRECGRRTAAVTPTFKAVAPKRFEMILVQTSSVLLLVCQKQKCDGGKKPNDNVLHEGPFLKAGVLVRYLFKF